MDCTKNMTLHLALALLGAVTVLAPSVAFAETEVETHEDGPVVRRKILYRSTRVEITPMASATLNDAFRRNVMAGLGLNYHLTNEFGIGASFGYGVLHPETDLSKNVALTLEESNPGALDDISYAQIEWFADFTLSYVPIYGKFSIFKATTLPYDIHLNGGLTLVNEEGVAAQDGGNVDAELAGIRPGGVVGGGARLFLSDMISLNLDLRTLFITRAAVSSGTANAELKPTVMAQLGVSIFLPGTVKISR